MKAHRCLMVALLLSCMVTQSGCYAVRWFGRVVSATGNAMVTATDEAQEERKVERAENRAERALNQAEKQRQLDLEGQKAEIDNTSNESSE